MFTFAIVTGVKNHWLDSTTYGPASRKAWIALVNALDAKSNLVGVCVGTNKGMMMVGPNLRKQEAYYLARDRKGGDLHGQAPMLWVVSALLR
jgi:rhamnogalacturonyl hydrolase YesR